MREFVIAKLVPAATVVAAVLALSLWLRSSPAGDFSPRVPGADKRPETTDAEAAPITTTGVLTRGAGVEADLAGTWPRFRGANLDNILRDPTRLARTWPEGGPKALWRIDVGEGYAAAAIYKGRVYVLDYDREKRADAMRCLSLTDGQEIWRFSYPVKVKRFHGMSRTVPTVTDKVLVGIGPKCHVTCLDPVTGELRWAIDLVREHGTTVPQWYAGQCPLVDGDRVILAPGGREALLMAVEAETGRIVWKTPNPNGWQMTHSSVVPMEFKGRRTYVYVADHGVVGVSAEDGKLLWQTPEWRIRMAAVPSPLPLGDGRIFLTGGYNAGSLILQLKDDGGTIAAEPVLRLKAKAFDSPQHTPILFDGHLYAVRADGQLACADPDGKVLWTSGGARRFGLGPYLIANGLIYVMDDAGVLTLAEASPSGYKQLAQAEIFEHGHDAWGPIAVADGRMIVRDMTRMACLDVREP